MSATRDPNQPVPLVAILQLRADRPSKGMTRQYRFRPTPSLIGSPTVPQVEMAMTVPKVVRTMCPMNCHPTFCGMLVEVEGGKLKSISGDTVVPCIRVPMVGTRRVRSAVCRSLKACS